MGNMSASDAAPLPRLGEVYFDVRGESRSMRLSWYADTGVAVFSIWQGGTCTGTFRLPIADLPRMVQALQRGPDGEAGGPAQPATGQTRRPDPVGGPQPPASDSDIESGPHRSRSGRYHEDDPGYPGEGRAAGYGTATYREEPPAGVYHEDDTGYSGAGYEPEPTGPYPDDSLPAYPDDSLSAYPDDSPPGSGTSYHDAGDYEPAGPYPGGGRHGRDRPAAYPGSVYEDEPTGVYRGDLLREDYEDEPDDRYPGGEYPAGAFDPDYPTGPSERAYPGAVDPHDYPVPSRDPGYSPARPYAGPRHRDAGPPADEGAPEPRWSRRRREGDPAPGSFPYGQQPGGREARGRRR